MNEQPVLSVERLTDTRLPAVKIIEESCFSDPWSERSLEMFTKDGGRGFVCLLDGTPAAYCGALTVLDEADIARIATLPQFRRKGLAVRLLEALFDLCASENIKRVTLDVRESNTPALELYRSVGFPVTGRRRDYYNRPREAAVIMEKML